MMSGGFATTGGVEWSLYLAFSDSNLVDSENLIAASMSGAAQAPQYHFAVGKYIDVIFSVTLDWSRVGIV